MPQLLRSRKPNPHSRPRTLLLTLDAFNTLYRPRQPIIAQYLAIARSHGLHLHLPNNKNVNADDTDSTTTTQALTASFHHAFKTHSTRSPNYGKSSTTTTTTPGMTMSMTPQDWWSNVITSTFRPFLPHGSRVPDSLPPALFAHFASQKAYELFPDVRPFFKQLRAWKRDLRLGDAAGVTDVVVGVLTNSDPRVEGVLRSLGLGVGVGGGIGDGDGDGDGDGGACLDPENDLDFVLTSYEIGHEKPNPAAFAAAERRARSVRGMPELRSQSLLDGLGEGEGEGEGEEDAVKIHVGDELQKDYWGAVGAGRGWDAVLLDRGPVEGEAAYEDVRHITTLVDVQAVVASLLQRPRGVKISVKEV